MEEVKDREKRKGFGNLRTKVGKFNKTPILIAGLVILTGVLLALSLNSGRPRQENGLEEIRKDFAKTSLFISDEIRASTISGVFETDVNIETGDNKVTGAQIELSFDPDVLSSFDVTNGSFLEDPQLILKDVDNESGRASFVIGIRPGQDAVSGKGVVAVISFSRNGNDTTFINFLPQTLVSAEGFDRSVLKETISGVIRDLPRQ